MSAGDRAAGLSRKKKLLFATLTVLLAMVLFETVLTVSGMGFGWEIEAPLAHEQLRAHVGKTPLWDDEELLEANFSIYTDDRLLLWRLRSDLDLRIRNFLLPPSLRGERTFPVKTNARGFRGPLPPKTPSGKGLVLCLGGSNTFGWGLGEGEAYPARLREQLGGEYDVTNFGAPGYSSEQGRVLMDTHGKALRPRWVVIGYGFNDGVKAPLADEEAMASRGGVIGRTRHVL
ncbi:MAG: SGNH/GDSL hydrolase family protein, partial [Planctomycetota bacterium]